MGRFNIYHISGTEFDFLDIIDPNKIKKSLLEEALDLLSIKDRDFIIKHYGLNGSEHKSLAETARQIGISRQRAFQKHKKILRLMRKRILSKLFVTLG